MARSAITVANSSASWRDEARSPEQIRSIRPSGNARRRSRRASGALVIRAYRAAMARVRKSIAWARLSIGAPDGFTVTTTTRRTEADPGERLASGPYCVDVVALSPPPCGQDVADGRLRPLAHPSR